jgi:hypothetical protein
MEPIEIHSSNVLKQLKFLNVNKSFGPDRLHPELLKEVAENIAKPLSQLFKIYLCTKKVPTDWKTACVTPLLEKEN